MSIEKKLLNLLSNPHYVPLSKEEIIRELSLEGAQKTELDQRIKDLIKRGMLIKVKQNRYCLPQDADLRVGIICFRQNGSAIVKGLQTQENSAEETFSLLPENTGVALHGDKVLLRLLPTPKKHLKKKGSAKEGKVIRVLERKNDTFPGTLQRTRTFYYVVVDDPRIKQNILVPEPKGHPIAKVNDKVIVRFLEWQQHHLSPLGEIIQVLGPTNTPDVEKEALLHKYKLSSHFPPKVLQEAENVTKLPRDATKREDIRNLLCFTIDPDDAKDFDDALSIETLPQGYRVGVHIADVSTYVQPQSALDKEAQKRGNSTYLVGQVIPMLPPQLSNGICSLVEGEDRLTKSVFLLFDKNGHLKKASFANTIIRSSKRLTYEQAHQLLKTPPTTPLQKAIQELWSLALQMRKARIKKGSLDFDMPEVKIKLNQEGYVKDIVSISYDESHQLIEEFMLAANESVAKALSKIKIPYISRVHDRPDNDKLTELEEQLRLSYSISTGNLSSRKAIVRLLQRINKHAQSHSLKILFLRSLKQACYRARADGHYGLYKTHYAHFTSPIRRYADLILHRLFEQHLIKKRGVHSLYSKAKLKSLSEHLSITEQNSVEAERESVKVKLLEYFEGELKKEKKEAFAAIIVEIRNFGFFVELKKSLAYGLVHLSSMKDDLYWMNKKETALIGRRGTKYLIGQTVYVTVYKVDRFKRQIDFQLAKKKNCK